MEPRPLRFSISELMFGVAVVGIGVFFLTSLITFLNSPFLAGPVEEADRAPILFGYRALTCGLVFWGLLALREWLRRRHSDKPHRSLRLDARPLARQESAKRDPVFTVATSYRARTGRWDSPRVQFTVMACL
jgi:hypothetical protein